jgi:hypothetical protein
MLVEVRYKVLIQKSWGRTRFEEPRGKPREIFDRKEFYLFMMRSLTPQQAAENALAIAVQGVQGPRVQG